MKPRWEESLATLRGFQRDCYLGKLEGEGPATTTIVARMVNQTAEKLEPIFVSEDVATLWEVAWQTLPAETFRPSDPFVVHGFALLPKPIDIGTSSPCQALLWLAGRDIGVEPQDPRIKAENDETVWAWGLSHSPSGWRGEAVYAAVFGKLVDEEDRPENQQLGRAALAFWKLGRQVLAVDERLPRARRKEEMRRGSGRSSVTVLHLRRIESKGADDSGVVYWNRRWVVRGHWRNQWYPSLGIHKYIWIGAYIKGPESQPLVVTQRVVDFAR